MYKRAGRELEIFHHAAGEDDALYGILGIDEHAGVADAIKAFVVEGRLGEIGPSKIAGRDVDAAQPQFVFRAYRNHLQLDAGKRQPEQADALGVPVTPA